MLVLSKQWIGAKLTLYIYFVSLLLLSCDGIGETRIETARFDAAIADASQDSARDADSAIDANCVVALRYPDRDGDGVGMADGAKEICATPGFVDIVGDCDDDSRAVHPNAAEECDATDNNCNGDIDESTETNASVCSGFQRRVSEAGRTYLFSEEAKSWQAADAQCPPGYLLTTVESADELRWIHQQVESDQLRYTTAHIQSGRMVNEWWIGLQQSSDAAELAADWHWVDNVMHPIFWNIGEPNDWGEGSAGVETGDQNCGAINYEGQGKVFDDPCDMKLRFVCLAAE